MAWDVRPPQGCLALLSDRCRGILGHQHADAQPRVRLRTGIGQVALRRGKEPGCLGGSAGLHEQVDGLYDCLSAPGLAARHEVKGTAGQGDCHRRRHLPDLRRCPPQQVGLGDVAGLCDVHDQLRDVGGRSPVLQHHLDRGATHAAPHRSRKAGIDCLAH